MTLRKALAGVRERFREEAQWARDARVLRRLQARAWVAGGTDKPGRPAVGSEPMDDLSVAPVVAGRRPEPLSRWLTNRPRPGRPRHLQEVVRRALERLMEQDPRELGYRIPAGRSLPCRLTCRAEGVAASDETLWWCLYEMDYHSASCHKALVSKGCLCSGCNQGHGIWLGSLAITFS